MSKLEASLLGASGSAPDSEMSLQKSLSFDLPEEITDAYRELATFSQDSSIQTNKRSETASTSSLLNKLALLRIMTTSLYEEAITELLVDMPSAHDSLVAIATHDNGLNVELAEVESSFYSYSLSDARLLSRHTDSNIIESFYAVEGSNAQRFPYASALTPGYVALLQDSAHAALIIDLGEVARWHYIPSSVNQGKEQQQAYTHNVVPCGKLLNLMTRHATKGETPFDTGGKLSVQGKRSTELLDLWLSRCADYQQKNNLSSTFFPLQEQFYNDALLNSRLKISSLDALCTSAHWIAERICQDITQCLGAIDDSCEVILMGGCKNNGLLLSLLSSLLPVSSFHKLSDHGLIEDSIDSVAVAVLGVFACLALPLPTQSSCDSVGRLTLGSTQSYQRLMQFLRN
ncbi:MAG: anhydro-N-acetylmuramic acid kinase [Planctomycetia bacterium]|nr:anhydro-N-acetylmuramic acid kinase [Planctomycetia bacterium]